MQQRIEDNVRLCLGDVGIGYVLLDAVVQHPSVRLLFSLHSLTSVVHHLGGYLNWGGRGFCRLSLCLGFRRFFLCQILEVIRLNSLLADFIKSFNFVLKALGFVEHRSGFRLRIHAGNLQLRFNLRYASRVVRDLPVEHGNALARRNLRRHLWAASNFAKRSSRTGLQPAANNRSDSCSRLSHGLDFCGFKVRTCVR